MASSDLVLFSAAIPGKGGPDQVSEQWQHYWRAVFDRFGYAPVDLVPPEGWGMAGVGLWHQQNTILYAGEAALAARPDLAPVDDRLSLNAVYPDLSTLALRGLGVRRWLVRLFGLLIAATRRRINRRVESRPPLRAGPHKGDAAPSH